MTCQQTTFVPTHTLFFSLTVLLSLLLLEKSLKMHILHEGRSKVNGKCLAYFNGKPISLLGRVLKVHRNGSSLELKSTDNEIITVVLNEPLTENLEGWVEVRGTGQGQSNIICQHLLQLNDIIDDSFDVDHYNDLINVINLCSNPWTMAKN